MYTNRNFMIFSTSETGSIDFNEVLETSAETLRLSVDGSKSFVKWDSEIIPTTVDSLITKEGPYTYEEIVTILTGSFWVDDSEIV
jgi:tRNA A37 threonylcarbamoyladenosine synthetase subunit TsaC/SUA5/YrdC